MSDTPSTRSGNAELYALCGTVIFLGGMVLLAVLFGTETAQIRMLQYITSSVPVILGFAFMQRKANETAQATGHIAGTLNGKLDKRFSDLEDRLTDQINSNGVTIPADTVNVNTANEEN